MKKTELIKHLSETTGQPRKEVARTLTALTDVIARIGHEGGSLRMTGLGTFKVRTWPARTGRNPSNGASVEIPEKKLLTFKASSALKL